MALFRRNDRLHMARPSGLDKIVSLHCINGADNSPYICPFLMPGL
jgi:hypothetical protein